MIFLVDFPPFLYYICNDITIISVNARKMAKLIMSQGIKPQFFNQISTENSEIAFAGAALYILPALLIYSYFQEDILLGIQLSELK